MIKKQAILSSRLLSLFLSSFTLSSLYFTFITSVRLHHSVSLFLFSISDEEEVKLENDIH